MLPIPGGLDIPLPIIFAAEDTNVVLVDLDKQHLIDLEVRFPRFLFRGVTYRPTANMASDNTCPIESDGGRTAGETSTFSCTLLESSLFTLSWVNGANNPGSDDSQRGHHL